ncbi:Listeria/Bacterioides repeat-containing protein [Desulfotomaculum arcticum]|uniref:Listeria/Bacterioides repeat-containing protein n=1 Tax=Desulfotruncus arcticus DSM 17038 TaxID=1121424 RepID=A0A1I2NSH7_9FIRM|nr:S-layer homology domain-containing protein [Desulfotruncus arcticus]SFG06678.1 Listeria/Bacterioides repeat-containing protein [Desulfotomaculum arcticum] [Desulfotruncus arcticus DSM 17038]
MKRIILLTALTIGMLFCLATSSYATGLSSNLVTNGDGDNWGIWNKDTSGSYVDHWSQLSDLGGTAGYAPVSPFDSGAIGDNEFFDFWDNSTTNKTGCLYQDIVLTDTTGSLFSDIDAGNIGLNAQAYIFKYLPGDGGTIQIKFLDGSGSEIAVGPYRSSRDTNDLSNWELVQVQHVPVPSGARTIRVMLIAYAPDGNSYVDFDGIDVELCNLPDISIANSTANHTYNGTQTITMSGTASDPDGLPVTVSAAISGITQSTTIASGAAWNLSWDIASLGITDGDYTNIQVTADNGKGIRTATYTGTLAVDGTAPAASSLSPSDNATNVGVNDNLVINFSENVVVGTGNITIKKTSDDSMVETIDVTGGKVTGSDTSAITVDPATTLDGETGYYVVIDATAFSDTAGNSYAGISSSSAWNFTTADITAPTVSSIDRNSPAGESTNATSVTYRVTFSEAVTGVDTSDFTLTETGTAHGIIAAVSAGSGTTIDVTVSGITGDGTLRLDLNSSGTGITDDAGNALATGYTSGQTYTFDTTAPTGGSISINSGADYTTSTSVTLTLSATGASEMMVSEDSGFSGASYEAYSTSKSFTLSSGDGIKTVYAKYKDAAGNETSATISDTITLVTTAATYTVTYNGNGSSSGSVPIDRTSYNSGDTVTVAGNGGGLTKTGYTFTGWNTAANGSGTTYAAGSGTFIISADTTLYAKWVLNTASAAADLSFLYVSPGTLSPGFSASETEYTVSVGNLKDSMTVTACVYDTSATLKINGETPTVTGAVYGEYAATIDLEVGSNNIISVEVTARDGTTTKTYTITATRAAASHHSSSGGGGGSGGSNSSTTTDKTTTKVVVNGEEYNAGTTTTTTEGSRTVTIVTVDDDKIEALLEAKGNNTTVEIPISSTTDIAEGVLSGQTIKNMEAKAAVLVVKTDTISYTLPASEIDIDSVSEQIGAQAALKDIAIHVIIAAPPADTVKIVTDTADKNSYQIVVNPVEFEIICTNGDKTVEVSKFKAYVERTIAIPEGVDPLKITTAVVLNADGTLTHVPTQIISIDGKYYAKINSLTNSTYTVIYNPKEFKDVENHWAKEVVNDMGSRLVINGIGGENFAPDKDVTRAEFAAIMVKALGLKAGSGASGFDDVKSSDWYSGYIKTAAEYGIISGYANGSFGPADKITREQAMTMIARAMKITGLKAELAAGEEEKLLSGYEDREVLAEYARSGIAECIKTGVVSGNSSTGIAPKDNISRAEVAVMVRRLLQKSGLI